MWTLTLTTKRLLSEQTVILQILHLHVDYVNQIHIAVLLLSSLNEAHQFTRRLYTSFMSKSHGGKQAVHLPSHSRTEFDC